jgi:hypothetical protein
MNLLRLLLQSGSYMHELNNKIQKQKIKKGNKWISKICVFNRGTFFRFSSFYKSRRLEQNLQKPALMSKLQV